MKLVVGLVVLGCILLAGLLVSRPYQAVAKLAASIEARDAEGLRDVVDFPALRESVKAQINQAAMSEVTKDMADNPFAALGAAMVSAVADRLVDSMLTAEGLAKIAGSQEAVADAFKDAETTFVSHDRFEVTIPNQDSNTTFILRRQGILAWRLTSLRLPNRCVNEQHWAKTGLRALYVGQEVHRAENDAYASDINTLTLRRLEGDPYEYSIVKSSPTTFTAEARRGEDTWQISDKNEVVHVVDGCR